MSRKSFTTYAPTEIPEIELNGEVFKMNASIPGDILLDFISGADTEDPRSMAVTVRTLLDAAILEEERERWHAYIRDPANNVSLDVLAEIAGYASEVLSGNPQSPSQPSTTG